MYRWRGVRHGQTIIYEALVVEIHTNARRGKTSTALLPPTDLQFFGQHLQHSLHLSKPQLQILKFVVNQLLQIYCATIRCKLPLCVAAFQIQILLSTLHSSFTRARIVHAIICVMRVSYWFCLLPAKIFAFGSSCSCVPLDCSLRFCKVDVSEVANSYIVQHDESVKYVLYYRLHISFGTS